MAANYPQALQLCEAEIDFTDGLEKKNLFECTSCNRKFHLFQALGGHRASHKRTKGCFLRKSTVAKTALRQSLLQTRQLKVAK
ncbi:hypothetical protein Leryth_020870 [Lithospermum erythrorhizon]|nr:hypothetical protein Leryth_020870 [Lithospermum erythrorhizon]